MGTNNKRVLEQSLVLGTFLVFRGSVITSIVISIIYVYYNARLYLSISIPIEIGTYKRNPKEK